MSSDKANGNVLALAMNQNTARCKVNNSLLADAIFQSPKHKEHFILLLGKQVIQYNY